MDISKKQIRQVGNFVILKEKGGNMDWLVIKAVGGTWTIRYREDSMVYMLLNKMVHDDAMLKYLDAWIHAIYVMSQTFPDLDFYQSFYEAYNAMNERRRTERQPVSDEEDKKILEHERALYEMQQEAEKEMENEEKKEE